MAAPYTSGEFVWCRFPFSDNPLEPGPSDHIGYVFAVMEKGDQHYIAVVIYTTSAQWPPDAPKPPGVIPIAEKQAQGLNQKAFVIDGRRVAFMPATESFFPYINRPDRGVQAVAPDGLRRRIESEMARVARRPDLMEVLGPNRPGSRRQGYRR